MHSIVQQYSHSESTTWNISVPDEGSSSSFLSLLLHAFASLVVNRCFLESKITGVGVSPDSLFNAPLEGVGSALETDLAS